MALYVNTNVSALNGQKNLMNVTDRMNSSFEKLSSGSRINSAKDDAAGLQISDRLTTQIVGLGQATRNANDGISIAQIAEGALGEVTNNIQRMRQLVVQGGNRTLSSDDREALGQEFTKLLNVNNDIADRTAFGTMKLLDSSVPETGFQIQSGAQSGEQDIITTGNAELSALFGKVAQADIDNGGASSNATMANLSTHAAAGTGGTLGKLVVAYTALTSAATFAEAANELFGSTRAGAINDFGGDNGTGQLNVDNFTKLLEVNGDVSTDTTAVGTLLAGGATGLSGVAGTATGWTDAEMSSIHAFATDTLLDAMSNLVTQVDKQRAKLGAEQNGLSSVIRSNTTAVVNVSDARARITDTDFASETAELTRNQIIQQASTTILSQANQLPQTALSLLG